MKKFLLLSATMLLASAAQAATVGINTGSQTIINLFTQSSQIPNFVEVKAASAGKEYVTTNDIEQNVGVANAAGLKKRSHRSQLVLHSATGATLWTGKWLNVTSRVPAFNQFGQLGTGFFTNTASNYPWVFGGGVATVGKASYVVNELGVSASNGKSDGSMYAVQVLNANTGAQVRLHNIPGFSATLGGIWPQGCKVEDFNGDGRDDLVLDYTKTISATRARHSYVVKNLLTGKTVKVLSNITVQVFK